MKLSRLKLAAVIAAASLAVACSDDDDNSGSDSGARPDNAQFEVKVVNLTAAQPLSPVAVIAHGNAYRAFVDGQPASEALEVLAEGGDNSDLLAAAQADGAYIVSASTNGPVPPSRASEPVSLSFSASDLAGARLSVVTMLVNTNDAFTGVNALDLSTFNVGDSRTLAGPAWDSGTEANTEVAASIPGPAAGGEGFNAAVELRADDSRVPVHFHPGVVGNTGTEDGLPTSGLSELHRFDNPVSRIVVTRVQ